MPRDFKLELRCVKNEDGTFDGDIYDDDAKVIDPDYIVRNGDCDDIKELWRRANGTYKKNPQIVGDCVECFDGDFFDGETLYPE